ncbi:endonuclease VII domain-containing protein [Streptomyces hygroscopicus]|uniref:endonuclease VII domain-containing protein n=1 Tax=Streptomyces hygroscopicus TaxID=1912 RepID=UPI00099BAF29|nr:endonuclease VII domain-containing protein [Streptomyces hygroscopicus]
MSDGLQAYCRECSAEYCRLRQEAKGKSVREKVQAPPGRKRCPQREEAKPRSAWGRDTSSSDGWASHCRERGPERTRVSCVKRKYGLTPTELDALAAGQPGVCRICLAAPAAHVDHGHGTGRVRGVLCFSCNAASGQFKDRADAIRRAAAYLEGNVWKPTLVAPGVYQLPS